eukprot:TRINITY_DN26259_c0_g1_i2.p1 TRINITY_DN26259_c0_g1~~TRINITY_DN26259_c0_g1_i2.p1  ORF type:complete len:3117 (+),score=691.26 TRINITY_DN26259_c0_g1_i2:446-9352(+)
MAEPLSCVEVDSCKWPHDAAACAFDAAGAGGRRADVAAVISMGSNPAYKPWPWGKHGSGNGSLYLESNPIVDPSVDPAADQWSGADVVLTAEINDGNLQKSQVASGAPEAYTVRLGKALKVMLQIGGRAGAVLPPAINNTDRACVQATGDCGEGGYFAGAPCRMEIDGNNVSSLTHEFAFDVPTEHSPSGGTELVTERKGDAAPLRSVVFLVDFLSTCGDPLDAACNLTFTCRDSLLAVSPNYADYWYPFPSELTITVPVIVVPTKCFEDMELCGGHGRCTHLWGCVCEEGWGPPGQCNDCEGGYAGRECLTRCASTTCIPCSGRGKCSDGRAGDATCECEDNFGGPGCETCKENFYGPICAPCPDCNAGRCVDGITGHGGCKCDPPPFNPALPTRLDPESLCQECLKGYWKPDCSRTCPGGVGDNACSGHGDCCGGKAGSGTCTCMPGWVGPACAVQCPGSSPEWAIPWVGDNTTSQWYSPPTVNCSGNGLCLQNGSCVCNAGFGTEDISAHGPIHGYDPGCQLCTPGLGGAGCAQPCPCYDPTKGVEAHGFCPPVDPVVCRCDPGWQQDASGECSLECPGGHLLPCSGHGNCSADVSKTSAVCQCHRGWDVAEDCGVCETGFVGMNCESECPQGPDDTGTVVPCSGHGQCRSNGTHAVCVCDRNGDPGVTVDFCGDTCEMNDRVSTSCFSFACDQLIEWGDNCTETCAGGGSCGRGVCDRGRNVALGSTLHKPTGECLCEQGVGGNECKLQCPEGASARGSTLLCSGRGVCSPDALCVCPTGFSSAAACGVACPAAVSAIAGEVTECGGHGVCTGGRLCLCDPGWVGDGCLSACPGESLSLLGAPLVEWRRFAERVAGGNVDVTIAENATRIREVLAADPLVDPTLISLIAAPCRGRGVCVRSVGAPTCQCDHPFQGSTCEECKDGYYGWDCGLHCGRGVLKTTAITTGACSASSAWAAGADLECVCDAGYGGDDCLSNCTEGCGNGNCTAEWQQEPQCVCEDGFYPSGTGAGRCSVQCVNATCAAHQFCNANGTCECFQDGAEGFWAAPNCTTCLPGFWGSKCDRECDLCKEHGACEQTQGGQCTCFDSDDDGHWAGDACDRCKDGYVGPNCDIRNVAITPDGTVGEDDSDGTSLEDQPARHTRKILVDAACGVTYAGGRAIALLDDADRRIGLMRIGDPAYFQGNSSDWECGDRDGIHVLYWWVPSAYHCKPGQFVWMVASECAAPSKAARILRRDRNGRSDQNMKWEEVTKLPVCEGDTLKLAGQTLNTSHLLRSICSSGMTTVVTAVHDPDRPVIYVAYHNGPTTGTAVVALSLEPGCENSVQPNCIQVTQTSLEILSDMALVKNADAIVVGGTTQRQWTLQPIRRLPGSWGDLAPPGQHWPPGRTLEPQSLCGMTMGCFGVQRVIAATGAPAVYVIIPLLDTVSTRSGVAVCRVDVTGAFVSGIGLSCDRLPAAPGSRAVAAVTDPYAEWNLNASLPYVPLQCIDRVDCYSSPVTEHLYVAMKQEIGGLAAPPVVYRVRCAEGVVALHGRVILRAADADLTALATMNSTRTLYAVPSSGGVRLLRMLLYAVSWVSPRWVSSTLGCMHGSCNGTVVGVFGSGFAWIPGEVVSVKLREGPVSVLRRGTVINGTLIRVEIPAYGSTASSCPAEGQPDLYGCDANTLEVSLHSHRYTANGVGIHRIALPHVDGAWINTNVTTFAVARAYFNGDGNSKENLTRRTIAVYGRSFRDTPHLACRFDVHMNETPYSDVSEATWSYHAAAGVIPPWWADEVTDAPFPRTAGSIEKRWSPRNPAARSGPCNDGECARVLSDGLLTAAATYVQPGKIECLAPVADSSSGIRTLRVTLDGQQYSDPADFWVVGGAYALKAVVEPSDYLQCGFTDGERRGWGNPDGCVVGGDKSLLPRMSLMVVDVVGDPVRGLDLQKRDVSVTVAVQYDGVAECTAPCCPPSCVNETGGLYQFPTCRDPAEACSSDLLRPKLESEAIVCAGSVRETPAVPFTGDSCSDCPGGQVCVCHTGSMTIESGVATVSQRELRRPRLGSANVTFSTPGLQDAVVRLRVIEGPATALAIRRSPGCMLNAAIGQLRDQPVLSLVDQAGNLMTRLSSLIKHEGVEVNPIVIQRPGELCLSSKLCPYAANESLRSINLGRATFERMRANVSLDIEMQPLHCVEYSLLFEGIVPATKQGDGVSPLQEVLSAGKILAQPCPDIGAEPNVQHQYGRCGTDKCFVCPEGANCSGRELKPLFGYWHHGNSLHFYECSPKQSCPGKGIGGAPNNSVCAIGHEPNSTLCSVCTSGYGKSYGSRCAKCPSGAFVFGIMVLFILIATLWSLYTMRKGRSTYKSVVLRMIFSHLQVAAAMSSLRIPWSDVYTYRYLSGVFAVHSSSNADPYGFYPIDCLLNGAGMSLDQKYLMAMCTPLSAVIIAIICFMVVKVHRKWKLYEQGRGMNDLRERLHATIAAELQAQVAAESGKRGKAQTNELSLYSTKQILAVVTVIVMFCLYQMLVKQTVQRISCRDLKWGYDEDEAVRKWNRTARAYLEAEVLPEKVMSVMKFDPSVGCESTAYTRLFTYCVIFLCVYGIGVPVGLAVVVDHYRRTKTDAITRRVFSFYTGGFRATVLCSVWQSVIMMRKLIVVSTISFYDPTGDADSDESDDRLRLYLLIWAMSFCLATHVAVKPYERPEHNTAETLSLCAITFTLNGGLLFFSIDKDATSSEQLPYDMLLVALIVLNVYVLVHFVYLLYRAARLDGDSGRGGPSAGDDDNDKAEQGKDGRKGVQNADDTEQQPGDSRNTPILMGSLLGPDDVTPAPVDAPDRTVVQYSLDGDEWHEGAMSAHFTNSRFGRSEECIVLGSERIRLGDAVLEESEGDHLTLNVNGTRYHVKIPDGKVDGWQNFLQRREEETREPRRPPRLGPEVAAMPSEPAKAVGYSSELGHRRFQMLQLAAENAASQRSKQEPSRPLPVL